MLIDNYFRAYNNDSIKLLIVIRICVLPNFLALTSWFSQVRSGRTWPSSQVTGPAAPVGPQCAMDPEINFCAVLGILPNAPDVANIFRKGP